MSRATLQPSAYMRAHTVGRLKANPPSRRVRRAKAKRVASVHTLGTLLRLIVHRRNGEASEVKGKAILVQYTPGVLRLHGKGVPSLKRHLPLWVSRIEYRHAQGGGFHHDFSPRIRVVFSCDTVTLSPVYVKPFIED